MKALGKAIALLLVAAGSAWAVQPDRITGTIDSTQTVVLKGSVHPLAQPQNDIGLLNPAMKLSYVTMLVEPSAVQQAALQKLLAAQQDPSLPSYHKWLTPEQFGTRFGLSNGDLTKITSWLRAQGLSIAEIARGRDWIAFSGTVAQIQYAFHTQMHHFTVDGEERYANISELSIPKALEGIVVGFRGLNNFRIKPMSVRRSSVSATPEYSDGIVGNLLAPDDIATIYDITALYNAGINGTGMKIAVMGQTDVHMTDIQQFRSGFGLAANNPTPVLASGCVDPGYTGDEGEADLDLEWSGAVAREASIVFVVCDAAHNGVIGSLQYAVNHNTAPVLSMSYGVCEATAGQLFATQYETTLQQANSQGQTLMVSSGDSGAATCDPATSAAATMGLAVNVFASPPEVTAVGGTELNEGSGKYWGTNSKTFGSALSYIPELAWDDSSAGTGFSTGALASTGGGVSIFYPKPSWQTGTGTFDPKFRSLPDVAMPASPDHDGYIFCTNIGTGGSYVGSCANGIVQAVDVNNSIVGGTSVSCPVFAGIVALLNQQLGNKPPAGLGNINTTLYSFAQSDPTAFHDIPAGHYNNGGLANPSGNMVPCTKGTPNCPVSAPFQFGYLTGAGYDPVTGLGSVDAHVFVTGWINAVKRPTTTNLSLNPATMTVGGTTAVAMKATVAPSSGTGTPTGTVNFFNGTTNVGNGTLSGGTATINYNASALAGNTYSITATYGGDSTFAGSTSSAQSLSVQDFTIASNPTSMTISAPGMSGQATLNITPRGGFNQTLSYSCSNLPSESMCTFASASATSETLTIQTTGPSGRLHRSPFGPSRQWFYAMFLPGFLGLVTTAGLREKLRWRIAALVVALTLSILWMPACGGGSSTPSNPGTPTGTTTIMVTAATSGTGSLSHQLPISLTVQ